MWNMEGGIDPNLYAKQFSVAIFASKDRPDRWALLPLILYKGYPCNFQSQRSNLQDDSLDGLGYTCEFWSRVVDLF